jgi:predicted nucleic acid-binding protein
MYTVDASVHISAINRLEEDSTASQAFLEYILVNKVSVFVPTLLLVEISAAFARALDNAVEAVTLSRTISDLPGHIWVPLDNSLADEALNIAATYRLRGADAVYAAVARRHQTILVTLDKQQLNRLSRPFVVKQPADALQELLQTSTRETRQVRTRRKPPSGK